VYLPNGKRTTLHEVWDGEILADFKKDWLFIAHDLIHDRIYGNSEEYLGNLQIPGLSIEGGIAFASQIVSETSTSVTCKSAYQSGSRWIEKGDRLSQEYIDAGKRVALEQLTKASVRLAQLLETVAARFYEAQAALVAPPVAVAASSNPNPFHSLDVSVDLDECVFELADESPDVPLEQEQENLDDPPPDATPRPSKGEIRERRRCARIAGRDRSVVEMSGIDLAQLVLLKRDTMYFVTFRHFVTTDDYKPHFAFPVMVKLANLPTCILVVIDERVTRRVTRELLLAIFRFLGGVDPRGSGPNEVEDISFYHGVGGKSYMKKASPFGQLHVGSVEEQDVTDYIAKYDGGSRLEQAKKRVASMSRKMIWFTLKGADDITFVTRYDWINDDRIVFNERQTWSLSARKGGLWFIDARIVDSGDIDDELWRMIPATMDEKQGQVKLGIIRSQKTRLLQALQLFANYISNGMKQSFFVETRAAMHINRVNRSENINSFEFRIKQTFKR
jgi:hypothetical protein